MEKAETAKRIKGWKDEPYTKGLADVEAWQACLDNNEGWYGMGIMDVARKIMELIDELEESSLIDACGLALQADRWLDCGMSSANASFADQVVIRCHVRGDEYKQSLDARRLH